MSYFLEEYVMLFAKGVNDYHIIVWCFAEGVFFLVSIKDFVISVKSSQSWLCNISCLWKSSAYERVAQESILALEEKCTMKCTIYWHEKEYSPNCKAMKFTSFPLRDLRLQPNRSSSYLFFWHLVWIFLCVLSFGFSGSFTQGLSGTLGVFLSSLLLITQNEALGTLLPVSWQLFLSIMAPSWSTFQNTHALQCLPKGKDVQKALLFGIPAECRF